MMPHSSKKTYSLKNWRYWPSWLGIGLLFLSTKLPENCQIHLGKILGFIVYYFLPSRRHIADVNLKLCFPDWTPTQRKNLIKQNFAEMGISLIESAIAWWAPNDVLRKKVEFVGFDHLAPCLEKGKGAIFLCAHFTTLEIVAA